MMMISPRVLALGLALMLAGCGAPADRFAVAPAKVVQKVRIGFSSVEVRDVSLPSYAAAEEIHLQGLDGNLISSPDLLWADKPERAVALEVSQNLARMTGRRIAGEPWPFEAYPEARLELRFAELVATVDGQFKASGQYFVAVEEEGRERSGLFDQTVSFDPDAGPSAIAAARGQLILNLSAFIAKRALK